MDCDKKKARKKAIQKFASGGIKKAAMACNKPRRSSSGDKTHVVKACENGKEKIVRFGHKMKDRDNNPKARKSFRARHKCDQKKSKLKAGYWSCKNW